MFHVTPAATSKVAEYFQGREASPIRIFLNECGCGGPGLAMALDEPVDTDDAFDIDGFTYIVDKALLAKAQPVTVDYAEHGFKLDCALEFAPSPCNSGSCGSAGTCCS